MDDALPDLPTPLDPIPTIPTFLPVNPPPKPKRSRRSRSSNQGTKSVGVRDVVLSSAMAENSPEPKAKHPRTSTPLRNSNDLEVAARHGINIQDNQVINNAQILDEDPDVTFDYEEADAHVELAEETVNTTTQPAEQAATDNVPAGHDQLNSVESRRRRAQDILLQTDMSEYVVQMVDPDTGAPLEHTPAFGTEDQSDDFSQKTIDDWDTDRLEKQIKGYRYLMDKVAKQFFHAHDEAVRLQRRYTRMAVTHKKMAYALRARHTLKVVGPMTEDLEKKFKDFNTKKLRTRALEMKLEPTQAELDDQEFYERSRSMLQDIPTKNKMDMKNDKLVVLHMFKHKCEVCGQMYRTKDGLHAHLRRHTGEGYRCELCSDDRFFSSDKSYRTHLTWHRNGEIYQFCPVCNKRFELKQQLKSHEKVHKEPDLPCRAHSNCGKKFKQNGERVKHELYSDATQTYECPDCGSLHNSPFNLKAHVKRIHFYNLPIVPGAQCPPDARHG